MPHSRATLRSVVGPSGLEVPASGVELPRGAERRTEPRYTPDELRNRLIARHKYGESVTLIDLSVGGVQFETPRLIRPDIDVVLEIIDARTREVSQVVSRVLRAKVAGLNGGIRYRAAAAFRRPLSQQALLVADAPPSRSAGPDYLMLEQELKAIVEEFVAAPRAAGEGSLDSSSLVDALAHLRSAAERRRDPTDRKLGALLAAMIPALQRRAPAEAVVSMMHDQLAQHLPLLAIRTDGAGSALVQDCERITLNIGLGGNAVPMAFTAEFPSGFGLDASQFRLLKMSAYLVGLIEKWSAQLALDAQLPAPPQDVEPAAAVPDAVEAPAQSQDLPLGWHRVVLRYNDGQLLHGYSNDFYPDRICFQFSPRVGCAANERMLVPITRLKAVFFVKDLHGDSTRVDAQTFDHAPRGRKVQITFRDGEVLTGSTLSYKPNGQGFFVVPANTNGNNIRAYIVTSAIRHLRFV